MNLVLDSNNFDLGVDLQDFAAFPGFFAFGGVGDNSDIGGPANPDTGEATPTTLGIVGGLIDAVDANFDVMGFTPR